MNSGAVMNYDFGPKRHWRRWVWNRIAERVKSPRDALCIYLPGVKNYDLPIALTKGFCRENLIGVERNKLALHALRDSRALAVDADFLDAVDAAAMTTSLRVVFGDFCSGLSWPLIARCSRWLWAPKLRDTVFVFNLLRGRDGADDLRAAAIRAGIGKHRAATLATYILCELAYLVYRTENWTDETEDTLNQRVQERYVWLASNSASAQTSYRSTNQTFDTIVFRNPAAHFNTQTCNYADILLDNMKAAFNQSADSMHFAADRSLKTLAKANAAKRSLAAVMAHRTRRLSNPGSQR